MEAPLVSIIIPTYNRADLIAQTLDSIKAQGYTNWECIVVDDGGTDATPELLQKYCENDARFRYFIRPENRRKGANACRNYGFEQSRGAFVKWFDSDDLMHPDFIQKQVATLGSHPELDFTACFSKIFTTSASDASEDFNPVWVENSDALYQFIIGKLFFLTPSPLWKRDFLAGKPLFDETLHNAHETDFNFRMLLAGARFSYQKETLFYVRRSHQSIDRTANSNTDSLQSQFDYFDKVYHLIGSGDYFSADKTNKIRQYTIFRKAIFYSLIVQLGHREYAAKDLKILLRQLRVSGMPALSRIKYTIGLYLFWYCHRGYWLIYQKQFDLR